MPSELNISRHDFLNGAALSLTAGATLSPLEVLAMSGNQPLYYPPALTGLRGSHPGSFEIAHAMMFSGAEVERPARHSDSSAYAYIDGAIDAADRAVNEQLAL